MEKRGVMSIVIATETFRPLVLAQAKARRVDARLVTVPHPLGGLNADEMSYRIADAINGLVTYTGGRA
ncbi:MAG: hypothetical protein ACI9W2_003274 [Gammaproteobacteria bacterium]